MDNFCPDALLGSTPSADSEVRSPDAAEDLQGAAHVPHVSYDGEQWDSGSDTGEDSPGEKC